MPGNLYTVTPHDISLWPKSNYVDPVERTWLPGYAIFWEVFSTILVGGRIYLRVQNRSGSFGLDDAFIVIAWAFSVAFTGMACVSVWQLDVGRHVWDVRPENYKEVLRIAWVSQVMFVFSTCATKMSVLLFYRRMVKDTYNKGWSYTVWILMFITFGSWIGIFFAYCFICSPLKAYWSWLFMTESYTCLDGDAMTIASGVLTIASDFWTAALPCAMFQMHDLGVSKRQKTALNIIFCLGFLCTGVGIARTYYLWELGRQVDLSWVGYDLFVCSVVECQLAIICTCAPFLRAFFRRYFPDLTNRTRQTNSDGQRTADRTSIGQSTVRGSYTQPLKPVPLANIDTQEEKTGFLVREESSGRLVWSSKAQRMSQMLSTEPVEYT